MPSKLFVGNLPENIDSTRLKQVFQPFCKVTECDIVKNYAFVHVEEEDVEPIIKRLSGYSLDGQIIHIKKSTSKLRPTPGMPNRCFRCQSDDHRTPQCPQDPNNLKAADGIQTIKIDLTSGVKRPAERLIQDPKRMAFPAPSHVEAEIPRPLDPDLQQLYQEYQLSRQRYVYYRDRLLKEMEAKQHGSTAGYALSNAVTVPPVQHVVNNGSTQLSAAPVSYQSVVPPPIQPSAPYSAIPQGTTSLKAPYAVTQIQKAPYATPITMQTPPIHANAYGVVPPQPTIADSGVMTTQQYLQQMQQKAQGIPPVGMPTGPYLSGSSPIVKFS
ncbi:unnamed protein product [Caenorhabditis bovis]|uniref:RRM domain-containing protein n=1 Tax=Caenorhabditis bovis TaxID=2654633 RepID=A0A8S1EA48_9PELO|nr:unnamed protein product [Caenorhabditis bovis]